MAIVRIFKNGMVDNVHYIPGKTARMIDVDLAICECGDYPSITAITCGVICNVSVCCSCGKVVTGDDIVKCLMVWNAHARDGNIAKCFCGGKMEKEYINCYECGNEHHHFLNCKCGVSIKGNSWSDVISRWNKIRGDYASR